MTTDLNLKYTLGMRSTYLFECYDKDGNLKWTEEVPNIVVNVGLNDVLDKYFKGSAYTAAFYVGLVDNASFISFDATDTMGSHPNWIELITYDEATREVLTLGTVSSQSVDNSASKASFTQNATKTVKGAFVTDNSTKNGGTGLLYGAAAFAATRAVESGDVLNVTVTLTSASA